MFHFVRSRAAQTLSFIDHTHSHTCNDRLLGSPCFIHRLFDEIFWCVHLLLKGWTYPRKPGQIYSSTHWTLYGLSLKWSEPTLQHLDGPCCLSWSLSWLCISHWRMWHMPHSTFIVRLLQSILLSSTFPLTLCLHYNSICISQPSERARSSRSLHHWHCHRGLRSLFACQDESR